MKFNVWFTITGPSGRIIEAENTGNPVESADMRQLLERLSVSLPTAMGIVPIGLRIEQEAELTKPNARAERSAADG